MTSFDFILKFSLQQPLNNADCYLGALSESGCDDALVGIGQNGRLALHFIREAPSAHQAVASAIADVKKAIPAIQFVEVLPDFVGLTDVAQLLGCTRQNMRKMMMRHDEQCPPPLHEGNTGIWHLFKILHWLKEAKNYPVDRNLLALAQATMQFNMIKDLQTMDLTLQPEIAALVSPCS